MRSWVLGTLGFTIAGVTAWGCGGGSPVTAPGGGLFPGVGGTAGALPTQTGGAGGVVVPAGAGVGAPCSDTEPCRPGLACASDRCEPSGASALGDTCVIAAECESGSQCLGGTCVEAGDGADGEPCETDADCRGGLRCALRGAATACVPEGTADVDGDCTLSTDCFAGLACTSDSCVPNPNGLPVLGAPSFDTVECDDPVESGATVRALFEVPGAADAAATDFFSLPFPNDVRLVNGHPDLDGFPTPGTALLGFDPLQRYVDAVEAQSAAWGANPVAIFRYSGVVDWDSFTIQDRFPFFWIDVTPGIDVAEGYAANGGLQVSYHGGRTNAVCHNWMALRRFPGSPLTPGHTYAVWIEFDYDDPDQMVAVAEDGSPIERSPHLDAVLADSQPTDPELRHAWSAFAPFRDYIAAPKDDWMAAPQADHILNAAVITVDDIRDPMAELASTVEGLPPPEVSDWVRCDGDTTSPCPQAEGERACGDGSAAEYDEYHALVSLPVFQQGTPPYLDEGGAIGSTPVRDEQVCLALTVPKNATMPQAGWPLVVYAHGTGGSFRSHVRQAVAGSLADVSLPGGDSIHFAVLGIDQVQHGPRRGDSTDSPDTLFFNFTNPDAARGNPMQGAADQIALARLGASLDVSAATTGGDAIRIDPSAIVFFGHSQGSTHGSLALPYSSVFSGAVLSGNGASIKDALLTKTSPVDIAAIVPFALGDPQLSGDPPAIRLAGGQDHPGLTLLGQWIDPADPLHFARVAGREPVSGQSPKHVFQPYGIDDSYSPSRTMRVYAIAGGFDEAEADSSASAPDDLGINFRSDPLPTPVAGNVSVDTDEVTLVLRQYGPPSGQDGHFVVFDVADANADVARFLGMTARGDVPQVGE
jgi:hypothetical protein